MTRPKIINIPFYYLPITQKYFKQNICLLLKGLYFLEYFLVKDTIYVKLCQARILQLLKKSICSFNNFCNSYFSFIVFLAEILILE